MNSLRIRLLIGGLVISLFAGKVWFTNHEASIPQLEKCYYQKIGETSSLLEIKNQSAKQISGNLFIYNENKDSSYGTFSGNLESDKLLINFEFWSEGMLSHREISYQILNSQLVGDGFNYKSYENCKNITYNQGLSLIPYKVSLPLSLLNRIGLSYSEKTDLLSLFGKQDLLPLDSVNLIYRPIKGDSVIIARYFLWAPDTWKSLSKVEGPPIAGQAISINGNGVLSVSSVQDCVFDNKSDCANVTQLYELINEPDSYVKRAN